MLKIIKRYPGSSLYFFSWFLYFSFFWFRSIFADQAGNIVAGNINLWGDWTSHFTMGSAMAYRKIVLFQSPFLIGAPFSYPFFANLLSAVLIRSGLNFFAAFILPSFIFSLFTVAVLYLFYFLVFKSRKVAILGSLIFFLNGGTGFVQYFKDVMKSDNPVQTTLNPPYKYTQLEKEKIYVPSVLDSLMIPQRALTHGFPLALAALCLVLWKRKWTVAVSAGILFGLMPLVHTHSFLALGVIFSFWTLADIVSHPKEKWAFGKFWGILFGVAFALAFPLVIIFFSKNIEGHGFISWHPGWYAKGILNVAVFWFKNWGITPVLAMLGLIFFTRGQNDREKRQNVLLKFLPFFILFAAINLFLYQPWEFDNTKILIWAAVGFAGLAGYFIDQQRTAIAVCLFITATLSGFIDTTRILNRHLQSYILYSPEEMFLADWAKHNTSPDSIWVQGERYHSWVSNLTGRQVVMTHPTLLWSHGYDSKSIQDDNRAMLEHPDRKDLYEKYHVDYIVVGEHEENLMGADKTAIGKVWPVAIQAETYTVYSTKPGTIATDVPFMRKKAKPAENILLLENSLPPPENLHPGLTEKIFNGIYFFNVHQKINRGVSNINFAFNAQQPRFFQSPCSIRWDGFINIPDDGIYEFKLTSDDGSWLSIDGQEVIDNGGKHGVEEVSRKVQISKGMHPIEIKYFNWSGGATFKFEWVPPAGASHPDLSKAFFSNRQQP